jgi:HSP20 family molecular chaperone IbpA
MRDALKEKIDEIELDADFKNQVLTITFTNEGTSGEDVAEILTEAGFEPLTTKAD